ncbi:MAG: YgjV family protein [Bacteroidales bacterium]
MSSILIQVIGFLGLLFFILSFQQKNRNRILQLMVFGQVIFLFHFVLLGAWTAAGMNVAGIARTLVFRFREKKKWANWRFWPVIFIILFVTAGLFARESWIGILPVVAMSIETTGLWMKNLKILRIINLFPHPFWFTYNLIKGSWAGVVCEIFVLSSIIVAIIRYDVKSVKAKPI